MSDQAKFQKMLEVLLLLDCQYGRSIAEISERFEISQRTVYRYLDTFKQVGFVIDNKNNSGYFKIDKENDTVLEISNLLHFSEEEAFILSKAIHGIDDTDELKNKLVKKLYSLYDFDRVIHAIAKKEESENIYALLQAIKQQKQIILESYKSGNSKNIRNRIVEPIDFTINYTGVWCYDVEDGNNKVFKTSRIKNVSILDTVWENKPIHKKGIVDVFRMQSFEPILICLELSLVAYNLIIEEYPLSEKYISKITDNLYRLECEVGNFLGVGRFILGLPGEVKILEPQELKGYIRDRILQTDKELL